jgi:DNA-binding CsgD family transcriptional regulator
MGRPTVLVVSRKHVVSLAFSRCLEPFTGSTSQFLFQQPHQFFESLSEAIEGKFVFYSHDANGRLTYVGGACKTWLNLEPADAVKQTIQNWVSDSRLNEPFRNLEWLAPNSPTQLKGTCNFEVRGSIETFLFRRVLNFKDGLLSSVSGILDRSVHEEPTSHPSNFVVSRAATLTAGERKVVELVVGGHYNKMAASLLNVSMRTVESRRSKAMKKLNAKTFSELVQLWVQVTQFEKQAR